MELTAAAGWITGVFSGFDYALLSLYHTLAVTIGVVFTPFMKLVTYTGEHGYFLLASSFILMIFKKTRRLGLCCFMAMAIGAVFTNLTIKGTVARPRPYDFSEEYRAWWMYTNGVLESGVYAFPSGHMTAATAFSVSCVLIKGRKYLPWAALYLLLMGMSRNYLMVHYPSDIIGGFIVGLVGAFAAYVIVLAAYKLLGDRIDNTLSVTLPERKRQ